MHSKMFPRCIATLLTLSTLVPVASLGADEGALPVIDLEGRPGYPFSDHLEAKDIVSGRWSAAELREAGEELFHAVYNGRDGVGVGRLPDGSQVHRFSVLPPGGGHPTPLSAQSCGGCHNAPFRAAAGFAETSVGIDPGLDGVGPLNPRATTSLFGNGFVQLLAQEMTEQLQAERTEADRAARETPGTAIRRELRAKGVSFGALTVTADAAGEVVRDLAELEGVDPDLVVRPLGWKGNFTTARVIAVGAANNLMGLQAEELALKRSGGDATADADGDGFSRELTVGDLTALVVYDTTQETPQSLGRLVELGEVAAPEANTADRIARGEDLFTQVGCATCHVPELHLENTVFEEPTRRGNGFYYDKVLAAENLGYDPEQPVRYDLMTSSEAPRPEAHPEGGAILRLYGDLKRHHMGRQLADPGPQPPLTAEVAPLKIDGKVHFIQPTEFLTPELWGVGNTGPWMHDARAGTLHEAISEHGEDAAPAVGDPARSEAQEARDAYLALSTVDQQALVVFLRSLRTWSRDVVESPTPARMAQGH